MEIYMQTAHWHIHTEEKEFCVSYAFSRIKGIMTINIDGEDFELPAGFLGTRAARREIFRIGDEQAVLVVDKKGKAELMFRGETVVPSASKEDVS